MDEQKKAQKTLIIIFGLLITFVGVAFVLTGTKQTNNTQTPSSFAVNTSDVKVLVEGKEYKTSYKQNETALELVTRLQAENGFKFEKQGEGEDAFLTSVNGRAADQAKREFWKILIDGKDATVGIGTLVVEAGDVLEFKIDTY